MELAEEPVSRIYQPKGSEELLVPVLASELKFSVTAVPAVARLIWFGAGILNEEELAEVRLPEVKAIVAPLTAPALVAVKPVKVAVPPAAALVVVPPNVQLPASALAAVTLAVLVVALPYWSWITTAGWVAKAAPFSAGAVGCVVMESFAAVPAPTDWVKEVVLYPVAVITMALLPELCKRLAGTEAEGVKVICPELTE